MCKIKDIQGFFITPNILRARRKTVTSQARGRVDQHQCFSLLLLSRHTQVWCQKTANDEPSEEIHTFSPLCIKGCETVPRLVNYLGASSPGLPPVPSHPPKGRRPNERQQH